MGIPVFENPYRPGAGHMPVYLAGRDHEQDEFLRRLEQRTIFENLVITGLRGVGKTVLLETLKPQAIEKKWLWVGTDLSESASLTEERFATRIATDLSIITSLIVWRTQSKQTVGFGPVDSEEITLSFHTLMTYMAQTPGLTSDKVKSMLELVYHVMKGIEAKGIVFAYDEAQNMSDHAAKDQYPLSLMLDVFQSIQKKGIPFLLVLVGLPTLFPKLVEARTYSERMFHVMTLDRLNETDSREAISKPIEDARCPVKFSDIGIDRIVASSGGYPYFIQFLCREAYDVLLQRLNEGGNVNIEEIERKLDSDFFMGRWSRATDRQRDLLRAVATLPHSDHEFTVQEVWEAAQKQLEKPFGKSQINQMLIKLAENGLVYKNRHGKYSFAVPLLGQFILRQSGSV